MASQRPPYQRDARASIRKKERAGGGGRMPCASPNADRGEGGNALASDSSYSPALGCEATVLT